MLSACEKICKLLGLDEAASTTAARLDDEAISKRAYGIWWDMLYSKEDDDSLKSQVIDEDYIKRFMDKQKK